MRRYTSAAVAVLLLLAAASALANSYSTPDIDGRVEIAEDDWDTDERAGTDSRFDCRYYPDEGDLRDLWVTWDATNLYFGVRTVNGPGSNPGNGYVLYIDTDAQNGITGATDFTSAAFYPRRVTFSTMGVDAVFGVWNLGTGSEGIRHCDNLSVMDPIEGAYAMINPGVKHYEGVIPWDGLFGLGEGMVPVGTTLRFVAAIVGGDNTGAFDALPNSSTGIESNPSTPRDAYTNLDLYAEIPVDANHDGVPDRNYPPGGSISGTAALGDPTDTETVVTVTAYQDGQEIWFGRTAAGGGDYVIERLADGFYDLVATAESYMTETRTGVEVADTTDTPGIDFLLEKVTGRIEGEVAISGGPAVDVTVGAYDMETGEAVGEGEVVVAGGTGAFSIGTVIDGEWQVLAQAKGYVEAETLAVIAGGDTASVGLLELPVVVATKYGFSDASGDNIYGVGTTVSLPDEDIYYYARAWLEPRDADDRVAYWDYGAQTWLGLSATTLDPAYPTAGDILFADADTVELPYGHIITADMFDDGRAPFLVSGDAVEVVRVQARRDTAGSTLEGFLEVGIDPPAPVALRLTTDLATIAAGAGVATISGQLVDASGNDAQVQGIIANMTSSGAGGGGGFSVPSPETDPDGKFNIGYTAATAGTTYVTATIDASSSYPNLSVNELTIVVVPDVAAYVEIEPDPRAIRAEDVSTISAQVKDAWGNDVEQAGLAIALTADPPTLLSSVESPIVTDATGFASGAVQSGTTYGTVEITGTAPGVDVGSIFLPIDATIRAMDEVAPESDPAHNSDPGMDLTALRISNSADELVVGMIFDSDWGGAHLGICLEVNGDAAGATSEPFVFPITYGHALKPDYAFTYKYYDKSYADFRRWNSDISRWQWQDWDTGNWLTDDGANWVEGIASQERQMDHEGYDVYFRIPFSTIGVSVGDTVRVEGYCMQETQVEGETVKYTALDSTPADATHDMLPSVGDWWETAATPVTLTNYQTYVIREAGFAPMLADGSASPSPAQPGQVVTYSVRVTDTGGGIGDVFVNLSSIGGGKFVRMTDDGSRGDDYARDGVYTAQEELTSAAANGEHTVTVKASDETNEASATLGILVNVDNPATAIREFEDPVGDDHGPNHTTSAGAPVDGLYYKYPTNQVFPDGAFDITSVKIFADGDRIVFRTYIRQLPNHQSGSAADWGAPNPSAQTCDNPNRTDLNLQKIDIYIDAMEGKGATSGFPNRLTDIAAVDAWDYGIAVEGWGKWFVVSNGSNSIASWDRLEDNASISMCDDYAQDWIDVSVDRLLLGLPEDPTDNDAIGLWDIIVCLSSHDGDSNRDNLGGIRWVNGNTSEWQIGGGRDGEGGRDRDANIMDIAASPGLGHEPGRSQEEMLDYTTPEAMRRFDDNKVACVIEASFAVDTSPPVISDFASDPELQHVPWMALNGAPAVIWTTITDVTGVDVARLYWQPVGLPAFRDSVEMLNLIGDIWGADLAREQITAHTNVVTLNKVGDARVLEGWVYAVDASDSANAITTSPVTFGVLEPWWDSQTITVGDTLGADGEQLIVFQDGTALNIQGADLPEGRGGFDFTVAPIPESLVDTSNIRGDMEFVGVARDVTAAYEAGGPLYFESAPDLTLHYPQYDVGGLAEDDFGLFEWMPETERWVLKGGSARPSGNTVTGQILDGGTYGIFYWESLDVGGAEGLSGVMVEPNPFSPNGDGLYDETAITYFLGREADYVNIEFYDLEGRLVRRLVFQEATDFTGRTPITREWDGTDENNNVVPYGIYIMRVEAKFKTEPTFERVNRPVVIIK